MKKLRIGVFMGGKSIEREASFNSGRTICDHLDALKYDIVPLFQTTSGAIYILPNRFLHRGKTTDFEFRLSADAQEISWDSLKIIIDFMYIAIHGRYAEDGSLQGFLEILNIPYLGPKVGASATRADKIIQKDFLHHAGIAVPQGVSVSAHEIEHFARHQADILSRILAAGLEYPLITKPHKEGSSLGVSIVHSQQELHQALIIASHISPEHKQSVLIEEKVEGMEFSCIVLQDLETQEFFALPITEIVPEPGTHIFDYEQKYMPGRSIKYTPARCEQSHTERIKETAIHITKIMGINTLARIDGFLDKNNAVIILDVNTIAGMAPTSFLFRQAAEYNMTHTSIINHLIESELRAYHMDSTVIDDAQIAATKTDLIKVAVLFGGNSHEREISLESGRNIIYKLSPHKYEAVPLFVSESMELYCIDNRILVSNSTKEIEEKLHPSMKVQWTDLPSLVDFVFIALHGGHGENGAVQGTLEMLDLPYNGSSIFTSALCMDKYKSTQFLKARGFDVSKSLLISKKEWSEEPRKQLERIVNHISFPCIVKPHDDGCSFLVQKANGPADLEHALNSLFSHNKSHAMIEEYIQGMELTVGVIGNKSPQAMPPSQAIANDGILSIQEKFLPGAGENRTPAPLSESALRYVQRTMELAYEAVGCRGYARIDCFYQTAEQSFSDKERVVLLEINTLPGMTPATCIFHQAAECGINPMEFIDMIISLGFQAHWDSKNNTHNKLNMSYSMVTKTINERVIE